MLFNKCYDPGDVPESESLPVPETTTPPKPLEVPVVDVVIVVVQLNSILNPCEFVLLLFYADHL